MHKEIAFLCFGTMDIVMRGIRYCLFLRAFTEKL